MGRDKMYLRYEEAVSVGVIVSGDSNIAYDSSGKFLLLPALEKVGVWNVRQGVCAKTFAPTTIDSSSRGHALAVTSIASSPSNFIAVGYADGSIRIWDCEKGTCETTLNGHKGAVTALRYNKLGSLLASGSKDNDIILWDVVGETGLYRLRGHRHQVTDLVFVDSGKKLVSSSKDKFLRVWDLDTQYCMQIVSGHHSEIWSIDVDPEERYLVTGSSDPELRFYTISNGSSISRESRMDMNTNDKEVAQNKWEVLNFFGEIQRQNKSRVATVRFNHSGRLLACQVAGKMVEIFHVLDEAECKRKSKKRIRRKVKKASKSGLAVNGNEFVVAEDALMVDDVFELLQTLRASSKISSISFSSQTTKSSIATLALALTNNLLETYSIESFEKKSVPVKSCAIELQGHRAEIRSVALSSDNTLLMSTSHSAIKIWNPSTGSCLRTIDSGYGLCSLFVPGNKYAVIGTKEGKLEVVDVRSGTCVDVVEAHGASVESIAPIPDGSGFVTGSVDHDVKFWEYKTTQKPGQDTKHLTVSPVRNMKMDSDVHVVAVCPSQKHMAVALMDNSMRVFYMDTLKLRLTLYGHKFPVLCMDISSDGDLLVSGSADKDLKIWGLDYGNCHASIFAHSDSVTAVKFVPNTHYIFSAGKDRLVKYWDADNRQLLLTLDGHHAEFWCLAISNRGDFLVSGSHDRSMRRWDRTEEQFHIQEEKERRLEEMFESDVDNAFNEKYDPKEELPEQGATALAGKKTRETLTATDSILDALDVAGEEQKRLTEHEEAKLKGKAAHFTPNIIMLGRSPSEYVLNAVANVRTNDLEQTLLALPFSDALNLLSYLKGWAQIPDKIELVGRVATLLLQIHHFQLVSTVSARPVVTHLKDILHTVVKERKDTIGFNLAAILHLLQLMSQKSDTMSSDTKAKVLEIRAKVAQWTQARSEIKTDKKKKKKQKTSDNGHVWS